MFGSKRRAKAKAEKLQADQRKKDVASKIAHEKKNGDLTAKTIAEAREAMWPAQAVGYKIDPATGLMKYEVGPATQYSASWDIGSGPKAKDADKDIEWHNSIEGSLDEYNKFEINFDGDADLENLQMISNVLNLHISKLQNEKYKEQQREISAKDEAMRKDKEYNALIDKRMKEQREHELKVIAAKKEAGVPLAPTVEKYDSPKIPLSGTPPLNGSTGPGMGQSASEAYLQYQQMQSAMNRSKQYG